jgi:hypothetical protein
VVTSSVECDGVVAARTCGTRTVQHNPVFTGVAAGVVATIHSRIWLGILLAKSAILSYELRILKDAAEHREMRSYEIALLSLGLTPIGLLLGALLITGGVLFVSRFRPEELASIGIESAGVLAIVAVVAILVLTCCAAIRPVELFVADSSTDGDSVATDPYQQLIHAITLAESDVCTLITRTDKFIQNDVGKPGQDDPSLITAAQQAAREKAGGDITVCPSTWPLGLTQADSVLSEAENRITRMELTLKSFTGPEIQKTYTATVQCEGFDGADGATASKLAALQGRLAAVQQTIIYQQKKLLKPIDDKTADLRAGKASDCDMRRGAKTAVATSNKAPLPSKA